MELGGRPSSATSVGEELPISRGAQGPFKVPFRSRGERGVIDKMSRADFEKEFGENRAIAALAVLVEDPVVGKKRVIHDGSHEVQVNHRIKIRDKIRMPGAREKRFISLIVVTSGRAIGDSSTKGRSRAFLGAWWISKIHGSMSTGLGLLASRLPNTC